MKHKWLRNFDSEGNWTKPERVIVVDGVEHDLDEYAKAHGVELPGKLKPKKKNKVNSYADMEQSFDSGDTEIDGDGDSEESE